MHAFLLGELKGSGTFFCNVRIKPLEKALYTIMLNRTDDDS